MKFITRLSKLGYLQPKQLQAALWLQEAPHMPELVEECRLIARRSFRSHAPVYAMMIGAIRNDVPFRMDETSIGMVREALNAAYRIMIRQIGRMAA
jgi:hypothetical protein